jgi:hypothetical protein
MYFYNYMKLNNIKRVVVIVQMILVIMFLSVDIKDAFGASLSGKILERNTDLPVTDAIVTIGDLVSYTDVNGRYNFDNIPLAGDYLITATAGNHNDYGKRITITEGQNYSDIELINTGEYNADGYSECIVTIDNPDTRYAHIKCSYIDVVPNETVKLAMHYVYNQYLKIENISAVDDTGSSLPFNLQIRKEDFYWYDLTIENSANIKKLILEYDIHYLTICHDGNPDCYHGYISDSYGVFENMNHILFSGFGFDLNGPKTAVKFDLPIGWVVIAPWQKVGDFYIGDTDDILFASPGAGRFEIHRLLVNGNNFIVGIHENANEYAPLPSEWPITIQLLEQGIVAANQLNPFESDHSFTVGIPPLGTNEGGVNSAYSPADNFPALFANLSGMDDIRWCESHWTHFILEYFSDIILYTSGNYSKSQYERLIDEDKNYYLENIVGSPNDLSIADLEDGFSPHGEIKNLKIIKTKLFVYLLDYEIRKVTNNDKTISDVLLYWRHNLNHFDWSNLDALALLNDYIEHDFTQFFNSYLFGNETLPINFEWYFSNSHPSANAGIDRSFNEGERVFLDAANSLDPDGDILSYKWKQINGPAVTLDDDTSINPSFLAPSISDPSVQSIRVDFELIITYLENLWDSDDVNIEIKNISNVDEKSTKGGGGGGCYIDTLKNY